MIQGLSLRVKEFLTVFIGQQILYCLEKVVINSPYAVSTSADLNTLSQHSSARLFESDNSVFSLIIRFFYITFLICPIGVGISTENKDG